MIKEVSKEFPPNYQQILETFPNCVGKAVFAYNTTIFNPYKLKFTPDLVEHENCHSVRQGNDPEKWWNNYLKSPSFRESEEVLAMATQLKWAKQFMRAKDSDKLLERMAESLCSPLYKLDLTYHQAHSKIRHSVV